MGYQMVATLTALAGWAIAFISTLIMFLVSGVVILVQLISQIVVAVSPMFVSLYHSIINLF
jgi:hypothetical protein